MGLKKYLPSSVVKNLNIWIDSIEWVMLNSVCSYFPSQHLRRFLLRWMGAKIAKGVWVYGGSEYRAPEKLVIGKGSSIGHRALLDARRGLIIGENVVIATEVMIWTLHHDYNDINFNSVGGTVSIGDLAWLGSRCIILPGVSIGKGAVVAAGAVVTKNVEPYTVVGGIPAKPIAKREVKDYNYDPNEYYMHFA